MKTSFIPSRITAILVLAVFSTATHAEAVLPPSRAVVSVAVNEPAHRPTHAFLLAVTAGPVLASAQWSDIKNLGYDQRTQFFTGLQRLEARVDDQLRELTAQRAAMNSTTDTKAWDFNMKEMVNARAYLKSTGEELRKTTPETWDQLKEKVGQAWTRSQEAYAKVKASTTTG